MTDFQRLEARMLQVEASLNRWRLVAVFVVVLAMLGLLAGQMPIDAPRDQATQPAAAIQPEDRDGPEIHDTIYTRRLVIVDAANRARTEFKTDEANRNFTRWLDTTGKTRVFIETRENGLANLWMTDPKETERLRLAAGPDRNAGFMLFDENEKVRIAGITSDVDDAATLRIQDPKEVARLRLGTKANSTSLISLFDTKGTRRWVSGIDRLNRSVTQFFDTSGNSRIQVGIDVDDKASAQAFDEDGQAFAIWP